MEMPTLDEESVSPKPRFTRTDAAAADDRRGPPAAHCPGGAAPARTTACGSHRSRRVARREQPNGITRLDRHEKTRIRVGAADCRGEDDPAGGRVADDRAGDRRPQFDRRVAGFANVARQRRGGAQVDREERGGLAQLTRDRRPLGEVGKHSLFANADRHDQPEHDARDGQCDEHLDQCQPSVPAAVR